MPEPMPDLIEIDAVAEKLRCHSRTVRRLADAGKMPRSLKIGGLIRWKLSEIVAWIDAGCPATVKPKRSKA